eukprot:SAG11_NODE_8159_length_1054_cov_0.837696_1_plen_50_part_00
MSGPHRRQLSPSAEAYMASPARSSRLLLSGMCVLLGAVAINDQFLLMLA